MTRLGRVALYPRLAPTARAAAPAASDSDEASTRTWRVFVCVITPLCKEIVPFCAGRECMDRERQTELACLGAFAWRAFVCHCTH
jgi:hypothetical protein